MLWMTADGERVDTDTEKLPMDTVCQAESSQIMEGYNRMRVGWREGRCSEIDQISVKAFAVAP